MNFINFIKSKELLFSVVSSNKSQKKLKIINEKNKIFFLNREENIINLIKLLKTVQALISNNTEIYLIIAKADYSPICENFIGLLKNRNVRIISGWRYGQLTNKFYTNLSKNSLFWEKKTSNQVAVVVNGDKNKTVLGELKIGKIPVISVGSSTLPAMKNIAMNLESLPTIFHFFSLLNFWNSVQYNKIND